MSAVRKRIGVSVQERSYNRRFLVIKPVNLDQSVVLILFVLGSRGKIEVGVLVHRQEILVVSLAKCKVGLRHVGAVIVVESAGTDMLIR